MTTLVQASMQWATRPADERFASLADLHAATTRHRNDSVERTIPYRHLTVGTNGDGTAVTLTGPQGGTADLTHWAFGQLAARAEAPASYLRTLPAPLAAENLRHGLADRATDDAALLFRKNGGLTVRALNSPQYSRIWDADISQRLLDLPAPWAPAPAAFDGSRGLYASDHDMFAFMVDSGRRIFETLPGGGLSRGFFVWNSEVGAAAFNLLAFLYEYVCGNHRVWGASQVKSLRIVHKGDANRKAAQFVADLREYAEGSAIETETQITRARTVLLGDDKQAVLAKVFGLRLPALSQRVIAQAYDLAATEQGRSRYGDPRTAWAFTGGLTEVARDLPYADDRVALDRAAGRVLDLVF